MARFDLTDFEWSVIEPLLPSKPRGVPRSRQETDRGGHSLPELASSDRSQILDRRIAPPSGRVASTEARFHHDRDAADEAHRRNADGARSGAGRLSLAARSAESAAGRVAAVGA